MTHRLFDAFLLLLAAFYTYLCLSGARHNLWLYRYGNGELWYLRRFVICTLAMLSTSLVGLMCAFMSVGLL